MTAIVWSKDGCSYCEQAKSMLKRSGIPYEERNLTSGQWTVDQLREDVPGAKTVPQIFLHGEYVGNYNALCEYYDNHNMWTGNPGV
jgi:glutaredoxin 3